MKRLALYRTAGPRGSCALRRLVGRRGVTGLWFAALLAGLPAANAQSDFAIGWFTIGGDCGTSADSGYSVGGAVGHSDTGPMSGGDYALQAGFGGVVATPVQALGAPVILAQPVSQTAAPGGDVTLSVNAAGDSPITYQWQFDGVSIAGATASTLTLPCVQATNAGNYTVIVSNRFGALTSSGTGLRVPPVLGCRVGTKALTLAWTGSYVLQSATNALGPYHDLPSAPNPCVVMVGAGPQQFFRLQATPAGTIGLGSFLAPGQFQLRVAGMPGYSYMVQASTNLTSWTCLQTNAVPFVFVDADSANYPCRFYRTVFVPSP